MFFNSYIITLIIYICQEMHLISIVIFLAKKLTDLQKTKPFESLYGKKIITFKAKKVLTYNEIYCII